MARYSLVVKKSVLKDLRPIPRKDIVRILERIESLREDPRPSVSQKLSGQERYRIRQGRYRILYEVGDVELVVVVVKVGHRNGVYRG